MNVVIFGYGHMGKLIENLAPESATVTIIDKNTNYEDRVVPLQTADYIVLAIPLSSYETVLKDIGSCANKDALVIDICSVKVTPTRLVNEYLPEWRQLLITHPLFGPQSAAESTNGLTLVVCQKKGKRADSVLNYCEQSLGLTLKEMSAEEHDQQMALIHGLTFFIAEGLSKMPFKDVSLVTPSFLKLKQIADIVSYETDELLHILNTENPFAAETREHFLTVLSQVHKKYC